MSTLGGNSIELDWLQRWAQLSPHAKALTEGDSGRCLNYEELYDQSCTGAAYLQKKYTIKAGDRVVLFSTNEISSYILFFALARLGATLVPINFRLTARELIYVINDADPILVIYEHQFSQTMSEIKKDLKNSYCELFSDFDEALRLPKLHLVFQSSWKSVALIIYTSGTTGFPKGAMITHEGLFWNSINTTLRLNICQSDSAVIFLPLFHTGGWNVLSTPFFHRGAHVILTKKFDADQILTLSEKHKTTLLFGVPTTMRMMSQTPGFPKADLTSIRYAIVGGEPMPLEEIRTWQSKNIPIRQGYGLTEFGPNVFSLNETDTVRKMGSIGFPNFYVQVQVINEKNQVCKAHEVGELWLKGPMAMAGYWNNPKATSETLENGWLKTGDLVYFDNENYFFVVGRKKDMYKSGGENVYPAEIEKIILEIHWVKEVAVLGLADLQWGEVGHAYVVAKSPELFNQEQLSQHCQQNLAKFKIPKYFTAMADLPKGDSGKILKRQIVQQPLNTK